MLTWQPQGGALFTVAVFNAALSRTPAHHVGSLDSREGRGADANGMEEGEPIDLAWRVNKRLVPWCFGALVLWCFGALVLCCFAALLLCCFGALLLCCFAALVLYCFTALVLWCFVALLLWCFESSLLTFHTCPHVSACLWHVPCGCVHSARDFTTLAKTLRSRYPQRSRGPAYPSLQGLLQRHAASPHRAYDEYMQRLIAVGLGSSPVVFYFLQHSTTAGSDSK